MTEPQRPEYTDYSAWAGRLVFPTTPTDLTDPDRCPACLQPLRGATICPTCRLDLNHPAAADLRSLSSEAATLLLDRANLIGRMRYETHQRLTERVTAPHTAPPTAVATAAADAGAETNVAGGPRAESPAPATHAFAPVEPTSARTASPGAAGTPRTTPSGAPPAPVPPQASTDRPRRSTVQVTLLIIGVSLLSIAAIFFLIYAFIMFGLVWRSLIIGSITVAAIIAASMLRRRDLTATAEGIAVFAVVLVYLDAWALRANDMLGLGSVDGALYWGIVLLTTTLGFAYWHRAALLRSPNIAAFAALAPGAGLFAAGLASDAEPPRQLFIGFTAAAVTGIAHVATRHRRFERTVLLSASLGALVIAAPIAPWAGPAQPGTFSPGPLILAAVATIVLASLLRSRTSRVFATLFAIAAGATTASAVALGGLRLDSAPFWMLAPLIGAATATLLAESLWRRQTAPHARNALGVATISAAVVTGIAAIAPIAVAAAGALATASAGIRPGWSLDATATLPVTPSDDATWALLALAATAALVLAAGALNRTLTVSLPIAGWALAVAAVGAVPLLERLDAVVAGWLALAALALVGLYVLRYLTATRPRYRVILATLAGAALVLALTLSWANRDLWWISTLATVALLLFARLLTGSRSGKAALIGGATALVLLSSGSIANRLTLGADITPQVGVVNYVTLTCLAATALLVVASVPLRRAWISLDRRTVYWLALAVALIGYAARSLLLIGAPETALTTLLLPEWLTSLGLALALLAGLALWVFLSANRELRPERVAASIAATPALYLVVTAFTRALALPAAFDAIAPISAALLGAAASLAITISSSTTVPRWARETGVVLVAVPALVGAARTDTGLAWLAFILAGVAALLLAIDKTGLFASASPRRHYGWLALGLGTAGLWWRLSTDRVTALEPYVLPLAVALTVIALLIARAERTRAVRHATSATSQAPDSEANRHSLAAPSVALAGALVGLLPLGIAGATGAIARPITVTAVAAALLLLGSYLTGPRSAQRWLDAASLAGGLGILVTVIGRAALSRDPVEVDAWVAVLVLVLVVAAFGQARARTGHSGDGPGKGTWRGSVGVVLVIVALTAGLLIEIPQLDLRLGTVRAIALLLLFALVHLAAFVTDLKPLTPVVGWVAIAYAAIAGVVGTASGALEPLELATVPIAAALLTTGAHRLATVPTARSWAWLAPGLIALLVPSLLATASESPLWRLVALGVAAIAVLVIGAVQRLQAPFVIGGIVALWHGIATFQPQLRAVYEAVPWWIWLGIGGIILIVLAARYEKRIANVKSVAMRFAALR